MKQVFQSYLVEMLGTFILVLTVLLTATSKLSFFPPLIVGAVLSLIIYAGMPFSGAHYNPAVTLAVHLRGRLAAIHVPGYIISQGIGAGLAAYSSSLLIGEFDSTYGFSEKGVFDIFSGGMAELAGTFALVWVILYTATYERTAGNSYYGVAIGLTVVICSYILGTSTGGAFNPAVALGAMLSNLSQWGNMATYFVPELTAGILATLIFNRFAKKNSQVSSN